MFSSPASIRNRVDLPQPEGPTRTTKAPSSIGIETPCRTSQPPNDFRTSRICTDDILTLPILTSAANAAVILLLRGLTRLFCRCRWIKVVGFYRSREHCGRGIHMQTSSADTKLRTIIRRVRIRRVRCGRDNEQAAYRRHQAQT